MADGDQRATTDLDLRDRLLAWLADDVGLAPGTIVTGLVVVFSTEQMRRDGRVEHNDGRAYPLGEISPTVERGLITKAADDVRDGK